MVGKSFATEVLESISHKTKLEFSEKKHVLSFDEYLDTFFANPARLLRNSAMYMRDMFDTFGIVEKDPENPLSKRHYKLFDRPWAQNKPAIVGQEDCHDHIYRVIEQFVRQGRVDKLILLHGPNGSSKSSTAEAIEHALEEYSKTDEGAVYRFNWIFPIEKLGFEGLNAASKEIGFIGNRPSKQNLKSFAHLTEDETACKLVSEMKENPIFLLPMPDRADIVKKALEREGGYNKPPEVPLHILESGLSSKSKKIFDALLVAYNGDLEKVLQHVQVERFYYSGRYRTGIGIVEPQMHMDAQDKQMTMERNFQNLPPALQNIRLYEPVGELIDANRGFIEFSDLLKRPLEAFKYLLTTIEKMSVSLASGAADLDLIMLASTNEKHLDAFKTSPDWASFKGRFELIRVPYLLSSALEFKIYQEDKRVVEKTKKVGPHAIELLAKWAVLTRLKQPDPDFFESKVRSVVAKLSPFSKLALYDCDEIDSNTFNEFEQQTLRKMVPEIRKEAQESLAYEGRFGASPREMKMLLYFAAQNPEHDMVSPVAIFKEIEKLTTDKTVYDYLQFEPRAGYHDYNEFLKYVKLTYAKIFQREFLEALNLFDERQYKTAFEKYLKHVVAFVKNEKIKNDITGQSEEPNENNMNEMEALLGTTGPKREMREKVVAKIASWRVENPKADLEIAKVFASEINAISKRIYENKLPEIQAIKDGMLTYGTDDYKKLAEKQRQACEETFENLERKFGYSKQSAWESLVFLRSTVI